MALENIRIVLVSPIYGGNVGSVCRAMKNMGLSDLAIAAPRKDMDFAAAQTMATHANDVLDRGTALREDWNDDSYFNARSMDVYVTKLRKYLSDDPQIVLKNIHGSGFQLIVGD